MPIVGVTGVQVGEALSGVGSVVGVLWSTVGGWISDELDGWLMAAVGAGSVLTVRSVEGWLAWLDAGNWFLRSSLMVSFSSWF